MRKAAARWLSRFSGNERGSVFLIVGTFLVLLLFVGMATDFGIVLRYRRAMQNACDSGVLAGAQDLLGGTGATAAQNTAQTFSQNDMTQNNIQWDNFQAQAQSANGTANSVNPVRLAASIHATVPLFFLAFAAPSMPVAVQCAAQVVPAKQTGLWPIGMNYTQWQTFWNNIGGCTTPGQTGCSSGCPLIGAPNPVGTPAACTTGSIAGCSLCAPGDIRLSFAVSNTAWGSGNSGTLNFSNSNCTGGGASNLACEFALGSGTAPVGGTTPPPYCATPPQVPPGPAPNGGLNYPNGGWFACSIVHSKTGATIGSANGGTYGTGINGGINYICTNYKDPYKVQQGLYGNYSGNTWVLTLPLINPQAFINNNGSSSDMDIVGFANFEIDCPAFNQGNGWNLSGGTPQMVGRFVKWAGAVATAGNPNGVDTGVEVVILVQ